MRNFLRFLSTVVIACCGWVTQADAQCNVGVSPTYPSGCASQYFTSVTASGTGVVSTISYTASSCIGSFYDNFTTQGIVAPTGSTVNINVGRSTGYLAYLAVYIDWNNNGVYETTELAGATMTFASAAATGTYSFTIPLTGIVTNTNVHMRVFLGEPATSGGPLSSISPPCSAKWGESIDYYINATCTTPTLTVSPAAPEICPAGSTTLTVSGAGSSPTYTWSPATGLSATTGATVTSTPAATTTYTVTGYGAGVCTTTGSVTVTVHPVVVPVITPPSAAICPGFSTTLSETSGMGVSWQWSGPSGAIAGATNSSYVASPAVTTTYSVTAYDNIGCSGTSSATVTLLAPPPAAITPTGLTTVCSPNSVPLNATSGAGYTYRWFDASGLIIGATGITYDAAANGTYSVEITAPNGCKDTSAGVAVTINPKPVASATAMGPLTFCSYDSLTLVAGPPTGVTYQWLDGTAAIAGATNNTYVAHAAGTHDYRVKITNTSGCSDTTASGLFPVVINPAPVSTITASGPTSFCTGSSVTLSVPNVTGYTYQWYYGTSTSAYTMIAPGGNSASYTSGTSGYYYVEVVTPAGCTTNSLSSPVLITNVTLPVLVHTTPTTVCWGGSVPLSLFPSPTPGAPGITYQWTLNSAPIGGATNTTYNATASGNVTCIVSVAGSCTGAPLPVNITVNPLPNPTITWAAGRLQTATYYTHFQWYKDLAPIPGATSSWMVPATPGNYSVIVTDSNGCISARSSYPLTAGALTVNIANSNELPVIYPNPADNIVHIRYTEDVRIIITGMDGRKLMDVPATHELNISSLPTGNYLITLFNQTNERLLTQKLTRQ